ncbi:MAG: hypothetical protein JWN65_1041 [Solirubrobacterales bacterium]|nr:hypothetical protein [Solirubrobacterales bacterium]
MHRIRSYAGARPRAVILTGALVLGLAACGSDDKKAADGGTGAATTAVRLVDTARVERSIVDSVRTQRGVKATVTCPKDVVQEQGGTFECKATSKRGDATFVVTQKDDKGFVTYVAK